MGGKIYQSQAVVECESQKPHLTLREMKGCLTGPNYLSCWEITVAGLEEELPSIQVMHSGALTIIHSLRGAGAVCVHLCPRASLSLIAASPTRRGV